MDEIMQLDSRLVARLTCRKFRCWRRVPSYTGREGGVDINDRELALNVVPGCQPRVETLTTWTEVSDNDFQSCQGSLTHEALEEVSRSQKTESYNCLKYCHQHPSSRKTHIVFVRNQSRHHIIHIKPNLNPLEFLKYSVWVLALNVFSHNDCWNS